MSCALLLAEPIEEREWTSTAGTKLLGSALEIEDGKVVLQRSNGKIIRVPLSQLVDADQAMLAKHFTTGESSSENEKVEGLPYPQGQIVGPVDAGGGKYFLYLPKSLVPGRPASLFFYTAASGGSKKQMMRFLKGAEVNGWILANSVESSNSAKNGGVAIKAAMDHIQSTLPVDSTRFFFGGSSGGAGVALRNCSTFDGVGVLAYAPHGVAASLPPKKAYCYFINGATDYNRYGSAALRKHYKDNAFQRFHERGHNKGPESYGYDGMAWLNGRYLAEKESDRAFAELRDDYEKSMLRWAGELQKSAPHRALLHLDFLIKEYEISGANEAQAKEMVRTLSEDTGNVRFVEAVFAIDKFSLKHFSVFGVGSEHNHTNKDIQKGAEKLLNKYIGVPDVPEILENLQKKTV